jgi:hypothetical protein
MEPRRQLVLLTCVLAEVIASPAVAVLAMAFSRINLDAPGTPPWREDPCPGESEKQTKRCCEVDRSRFLPLRDRHGGVARSSSGRPSR